MFFPSSPVHLFFQILLFDLKILFFSNSFVRFKVRLIELYFFFFFSTGTFVGTGNCVVNTKIKKNMFVGHPGSVGHFGKKQ